jgi:hypothetical protein
MYHGRNRMVQALSQTLLKGGRGRGQPLRYATTPYKLATNFACPAESLPFNLFTCPVLIMCKGSIPSSVRERGVSIDKPAASRESSAILRHHIVEVFDASQPPVGWQESLEPTVAAVPV